MTDRLSLYNDALMHVGERFLGSLTENREPRRLLDQVWASGGVDYILERGQWAHATRTQRIDYDSGIEPTFGYRYAFPHPDDFICTRAVCSDEYFRVPLINHVDEGGYWYADLATIYVRFVSNDPAYGMNLGKWPKTFQRLVALHFGSEIAAKLTGKESEKVRLQEERDKALAEAKNATAQLEPTQFPAQGAWLRARHRYPGRRDGGNNDSGPLIGG